MIYLVVALVVAALAAFVVVRLGLAAWAPVAGALGSLAIGLVMAMRAVQFRAEHGLAVTLLAFALPAAMVGALVGFGMRSTRARGPT